MAANPNPDDNDYQREMNYNDQTQWLSTCKPLFNRVMFDEVGSFDEIKLTDLEGERSIQLMSTFANRMASNPPVSLHTKAPFKKGTLIATLMQVMHKLKTKFGNARTVSCRECHCLEKKS